MMWRWIDSGALSGAWNMAWDEALYAAAEEGSQAVTVRLYDWSPHCISLGHSQVAAQQLELEKVAAAGLDVVRRPTGGRAILHAQEITYSVIAPMEFAPWGATLAATYAHISSVLMGALQRLGVGTDLDSASPEDGRFAVGAVRMPCFSSSARSEVVWQGRKLVGSAQRRGRRAFLQHGSLLLGRAHRDIVQYLYYPDPATREQALAALDRHAACLADIPGAQSSPATVAAALRAAWVEAWGDPAPGGFTEPEIERAHRIHDQTEIFV